jgi:hypothetical protein
MPRQARRLSKEAAALRAQGCSFHEIALDFQRRYGFNARVAFRIAHGLTQQQVSDRWNELWPNDSDVPKTAKNITYWEAWPSPSGRPPSLQTLNRLALIYQCRAADLFDGENHSPFDPHASRPNAPGAAPPARRSHGAVPAPPSVDLPAEVVPLLLGGSLEGSLRSPLERDATYQRLVQALITWAQKMKRRELLQVLGWAATTAAAAPLLHDLDPNEERRVAMVLQAPRRVDATVVDHIEGVLWRCMRQDDTLGPQAALDTVLAQRNLTRALLPEAPEAPEALRARLLSVFSNLSRFAGWLCFDLKDFASAAFYYEEARIAAHDAHNTELGAFVLCNMSHLATWQGRPRVGIDHAVAAQGWARHSDNPSLRAYAADVAARAYALDREAQACRRELTLAHGELTGSYGPGDEASLVYFHSEGQLASTESLCRLLLGDPHGAAEDAERSLALIDPSFVRNQALSMLYISNANIQPARFG